MSDILIRAVREEIESHAKNSGTRPYSLSVAPIIYGLLEKEAKSMSRVELPDEHNGLHIAGVKIKPDDDLTALEISE